MVCQMGRTRALFLFSTFHWRYARGDGGAVAGALVALCGVAGGGAGRAVWGDVVGGGHGRGLAKFVLTPDEPTVPNAQLGYSGKLTYSGVHFEPMEIESFILQFGYFGLFVVSFLASTILPLSTELFVIIMPPMGFNIWLVGIFATLGNYLGALTMYYMGWYGTDFVLARYVTIEQDKIDRAQTWFARWGPPTLLLSWMPFIGDPLCAVAGSLKMPFTTFTIWTIIGKGLRYVVLLGAVYTFI